MKTQTFTRTGVVLTVAFIVLSCAQKEVSPQQAKAGDESNPSSTDSMASIAQTPETVTDAVAPLSVSEPETIAPAPAPKRAKKAKKPSRMPSAAVIESPAPKVEPTSQAAPTPTPVEGAIAEEAKPQEASPGVDGVFMSSRLWLLGALAFALACGGLFYYRKRGKGV